MHMLENEHEYALALLTGIVSYYRFESLLDIGSGTGRVLRHAKARLPGMRIMGVEPVPELRQVAYRHGIGEDELVAGDALRLPFETNSWDIVCAFSILHHIPEPNQAVAEMCRVARHAVFFSDLNNFGCGPWSFRALAQTLHALRLWRPLQWIKNGGTHEKYSEGDGIHYSYSLFDSLRTIRQKFPQTFLSGTKGNADNLYRGCSHLAVFAVKSVGHLDALNPY
ncbi:MAG: class I SAM-dependent methyltransferase, partial [Opitutaceae bacterium]